ncbi:PHD finger protein ALFIN-LIKE 3-like [Triticum dicoccoides]|uniref:PHD finger protein ALFIN-LIKE 3-like n=1 Tax=Triticum dicoccoides TaxID=85692 RepID=UPI0018913450|nr:PHD finger protein ALFIN-LIKE 3-like [Triticum dicoccoides]
MDASLDGSSSNPTPSRRRLIVPVHGRPSPTPLPAHPGEWRSRPAVSWTVENIYEDFSGRRSALVQALTTGKEPMCLYRYPDGSWELTLPEEMVPPGLPVLTRGINRRRGYMNRTDYLTLVTHHSDSWLMGVTVFLSTCHAANQRIRLFDMVNEMRTVHDEFYLSYGLPWLSTFVRYNANRESSAPTQENVSNPDVDSITPAEENVPPSQDSMQVFSSPNKDSRKPAEDKQKDNEVTDFCGSCNAPYHANAFWIGCDECDQWFHGKCVNVTASEAEHIKEYKCPDCIREVIGE